jgi:protease secretion system membrane fusion protein
VKEGDLVQAGDVLLKVNPLATEANLGGAEIDYFSALAIESRLMAERTHAKTIAWKKELITQARDARVMEAKALQQKLFESRRSEYQDQQRIYQEQLLGLQAQLRELQTVVRLRKEQLQVMAEESNSNRDLASQGFIPKSKANEVERARSDMLSSLANVTADIAKTQASISSTRLQATQHQAAYRKEADKELAEVQKSRKTSKGKVDALSFDLKLSDIKAPVTGTVVGLKANTVGGVIQSGQVLMEIVPQDSGLVVEAQVPPALIDKVQVGLLADLRFSAFNLVSTPVVNGVVKVLGADKLSNPAPIQPAEYYLAQIETTQEGLQLLGDRRIQAGMPVEVIVKSGERSFMSYLFKPITDRFARSFKEN